MTDLAALNMRQTASYQADTISSLQARVRLLETQELGASPSAIETIQDTAGAMLTDSSSIDFTYDDALATITAIIIAGSVTSAMLRNSAALSVIGRTANNIGVPGDIAASAASGAVLRESGSAIGFGTVATAGIADAAITNAKLADMVQTTVKGRAAGAGTGVPGDLTATQLNAIWGSADAFNASNVVTLGAATDEGRGQMGTTPLKLKGQAALLVYRESADSQGVNLEFLKRRSGTGTVLQSGDQIGSLAFTGADTTTFGAVAARIMVEVDGTPGSADMPGRIVFLTSPDGTASPTEAMRINALQNLIIADGKRIESDEVRARDAGGLVLKDDGGNLGVFVEDGGKVAIGTALTNAKLTVSLSHATAWVLPPSANDLVIRLENPNASADFVGWQFANRTTATSVWLMAMEHQSDYNGDMLLATRTGAATYAEKMRWKNNGNVGVGTSDPQGLLHGHDGTGGFLFVTKTAVAGTAVVIIPNATGDVVRGVSLRGVSYASDGTFTSFSGSAATGGATLVVTVHGGTDEFTFTVAASGQLSVARSLGSLTYTISLHAVWL